MTFKEARKEARGRYLTISKQKEIGWYAEDRPTQRTVYWVKRDGSLIVRSTSFAQMYHREFLRKIKNSKEKQK